MTAMTQLTVHAADSARLDSARATGEDGHGNRFRPYAADGGEPLRCCLRRSLPQERIALISWAPFTQASPWREVGPVYVHADACDGPTAEWPDELCNGPRLLRTYRADATMNYDHNTLVEDPGRTRDVVAQLLRQPGVGIVHVRTALPQCFLFAVTAA